MPRVISAKYIEDGNHVLYWAGAAPHKGWGGLADALVMGQTEAEETAHRLSYFYGGQYNIRTEVLADLLKPLTLKVVEVSYKTNSFGQHLLVLVGEGCAYLCKHSSFGCPEKGGLLVVSRLPNGEPDWVKAGLWYDEHAPLADEG